MMTAAGLKAAIDAKFYPPPTEAKNANNLFGDAVQLYLEADCEVVYDWVAVDGLGSPDPITEFIGKPVYTAFLLEPKEDLEAWSLELSTLVRAAVITPPAGFTLPLLSFGPSDIDVQLSQKTDVDTARLAVCEDIIEGVKGMTVPAITTYPGSRGIYTGVATMREIL